MNDVWNVRFVSTLIGADFAACGEMFVGQGWPTVPRWIMMCSLVFLSSTFIVALNLLLVFFRPLP